MTTDQQHTPRQPKQTAPPSPEEQTVRSCLVLLIGAFVALAALMAFWLYREGAKLREPRPPDLRPWPTASEVERITAAVGNSETGEPDVAQFDVPEAYVVALLRVLSPPKYQKHPPQSREAGRLTVTCKDGRVLDVRLVDSRGKGPVEFTLQGVPCIRGGRYEDLTNGKDKYLPEVGALQAFLRAIQRRDAAEARKCLERLDQSAGRGVRPARKL